VSDSDFLGRWARRKQAARQKAEPATRLSPAAPDCLPRDEVTAAQEAPADGLDLTDLPALDEITARTDITGFLRKGVPLDLSRAALRRAWAADPTIRDFIGLAENAWDFNDPTAMAGFGPLDYSQEQLAELVGKIVGGVQRIIEEPSSDPAMAESERPPLAESSLAIKTMASAPPDPAALTGSDAANANSAGPASDPLAGPQQEASPVNSSSQRWRRLHGGALPT